MIFLELIVRIARPDCWYNFPYVGNHEAGAEVPNAHLKMKNQAEVLGQANLLQSPGLGGKFDNNVKSGRDFKRVSFNFLKINSFEFTT